MTDWEEWRSLSRDYIRQNARADRLAHELDATQGRLARVADIVREVRAEIQNCGDAVWNAERTCDEILRRLDSAEKE